MKKVFLQQHTLPILFFLSGVAALTYQVCWQRILFFSFGSDIDSITIIVSTFMLGLGVGALLGGWLADRYFSKIIILFSLFELCIGLFGVLSISLIVYIADLFVMSDRSTTIVINFLLLLLPTALMGATLPMLVTFFVAHYKNVGVSTAYLYLVNTFGAAAGAYLVGFVAFNYITLDQAIFVAATINCFVAISGMFLFFRRNS